MNDFAQDNNYKKFVLYCTFQKIIHNKNAICSSYSQIVNAITLQIYNVKKISY